MKWNGSQSIQSFVQDNSLIGIHVDWRTNTPVVYYMEQGDPCKRAGRSMANDIVSCLELGENNWAAPHCKRLAIYTYDDEDGMDLVSRAGEE
jgi:hypothetical protein